MGDYQHQVRISFTCIYCIYFEILNFLPAISEMNNAFFFLHDGAMLGSLLGISQILLPLKTHGQSSKREFVYVMNYILIYLQ